MKTEGCHSFVPILFLTLLGRPGVSSHQGTSGYPSRYQGEQHPDRRWCLGGNWSHNWKPTTQKAQKIARSLQWWCLTTWLTVQFACRWHCEVGGFRLLQANRRDLNVPRNWSFETLPFLSVRFVVCWHWMHYSTAFHHPLLSKAHHARIHPLDGTRGVGTLPRSWDAGYQGTTWNSLDSGYSDINSGMWIVPGVFIFFT